MIRNLGSDLRPALETRPPDFSIKDVPEQIKRAAYGATAIEIRNPGVWIRKEPKFPQSPREGDPLGEGQDIGIAAVPDNLSLEALGFIDSAGREYNVFEVKFHEGRWYLPKLPDQVASLIARCIAHEIGLRGDEDFKCFVSIDIQQPRDRARLEASHNMHPHFDEGGRENRSIYFYTDGAPTMQYVGRQAAALYDNGELSSGNPTIAAAEHWMRNDAINKHVHAVPLLTGHIYHGYASNWLHSTPWDRFPKGFENRNRFFLRITCVPPRE